MGFLGRLFGSPKALGRVADAASSAVDKLVYTSEEKAEAADARNRFHLEWLSDWLKVTSSQNLARRAIALVWVGSFMALLWATVVMDVVSAFVAEPSAWRTAAAGIRATVAEELTAETMLILTFYFAPHLGEKLVSAAMARKPAPTKP